MFERKQSNNDADTTKQMMAAEYRWWHRFGASSGRTEQEALAKWAVAAEAERLDLWLVLRSK